MELEYISSRSNPALKRARALIRRRALRYQEHSFFAEGARVIETLLDANVPFDVVFIDNERFDLIEADMLQRLTEAANRTIRVAPATFAEMTDTEHPQPLAAICSMPSEPERAISGTILALDGIQDPGNIGALTRLAAAFEVDMIALLPGCVDPFSAKSVRASAGTVALVSFVRTRSIDELVDRAGGSSLIVAADGDASTALGDLQWSWPAIIIIGGEARGLTENSHSDAEIRVRIPIASGVESLNAASAGAILLWEAYQARNQG